MINYCKNRNRCSLKKDNTAFRWKVLLKLKKDKSENIFIQIQIIITTRM